MIKRRDNDSTTASWYEKLATLYNLHPGYQRKRFDVLVRATEIHESNAGTQITANKTALEAAKIAIALAERPEDPRPPAPGVPVEYIENGYQEALRLLDDAPKRAKVRSSTLSSDFVLTAGLAVLAVGDYAALESIIWKFLEVDTFGSAKGPCTWLEKVGHAIVEGGVEEFDKLRTPSFPLAEEHRLVLERIRGSMVNATDDFL